MASVTGAAPSPSIATVEDNGLLRFLDRISGLANTVMLVIVAVTMTIMCVATMAQVFYRYVLEAALFWPEELSRACLVWLTFAGTAAGVRAGTHIAITAIYERFPGRVRRVADLVSTLTIGFIGYAMLDLGWSVAQLSRDDTSTALDVSLFWYRLALPVGGLGILLNVLPLVVRSGIGIVQPTAVRSVHTGSGGGVV